MVSARVTAMAELRQDQNNLHGAWTMRLRSRSSCFPSLAVAKTFESDAYLEQAVPFYFTPCYCTATTLLCLSVSFEIGIVSSAT